MTLWQLISDVFSPSEVRVLLGGGLFGVLVVAFVCSLALHRDGRQ